MKRKLLVIDDDAAVRKFLRRALECAEYEVLEAVDGDEGVSLAAKLSPELILLDMHMPRLDGLAALNEIMAVATDSIVIMVTGDGDVARARLAIERGAKDYITKPISIEHLRTCVETYLLVGR